METSTAPRDWWDEDDAVLATAMDVLEQRAREIKKRRRR